MLEFLSMMNNHEEREVAHFEKGDLVIDTCAVNDSDKPYETGICHPSYNDNSWVIVALYSTKKAAQKGHDGWVKKMTAKKLPMSLRDVSTASIKQFGEGLGVNFEDVKVKAAK